jgi:hypothetical protein
MSIEAKNRLANRVPQTRFGFPHGNCHEACLASITGIPLELFGGSPWTKPWSDWKERSEHIERVLLDADWFEWLVEWEEPSREMPVAVPSDLLILNGTRSDGVGHAVVAIGGEIIWNPNPNPEGALMTVDSYWIVAKIDAYDWNIPYGPPPDCRF